ncbi:hypothetical protein [Micromonospora sp. NPDC005189]
MLDTMTFLNEVTSRCPAAVSVGPGRFVAAETGYPKLLGESGPA